MAHRTAAEAFVLEKRNLTAVTLGQLVGLLLWVVAISTDHWTEVDGVGGREVFVPKTGRYLIHANTGIWRTCRYAYSNKTKTPFIFDRCVYLDLFPAVPEKVPSAALLDQQRTVASFAVISCVIISLGLVFSLYTFRETRYMYKRLAACCHVIAAGCTLIVLEVSSSLIEIEVAKFPTRHPRGSEWSYGYSFIIAWFTFLSQAVATIAFAICSRKRKKEKAPNEQFAIEEEPTIIGR